MSIMENYGFLFLYKNRRLGDSQPLGEDELDDMEAGKGNDDNLYIYCEGCGEFMDFQMGKDNLLDGKWVCPDCKRAVRESTAYNKLDSENEEFLSKTDDFDDFELYLRSRGEDW